MMILLAAALAALTAQSAYSLGAWWLVRAPDMRWWPPLTHWRCWQGWRAVGGDDRPNWPLLPVAVLGAALVAGVTAGLSADQHPATLLLLAMAAGVMLALAALDWRHQLLADEHSALLGVLGLLLLPAHGAAWWVPLSVALGLALLGAFLAGPYSHWRGRAMLGWGDVKLFAALGLYLQPAQAGWFLAVAGLLGASVGLARQSAASAPETPFAPALVAALWLVWWGEVLWRG